MAARTRIFVPTKGEFTLTDTDHVATGGEGSVYVKKGYAIKLYLDAAKARQAGLEGKIQLLSAIQHPHIVAPLGPVYDAGQEFVGFYMPVASGEPLVKTFTNAWRDANGFTDANAVELVGNMRTAVQSAHDLGALLVDGNELNYLVEGTAPRLIDCDSWQIDHYKATAIMPSIRDHSAKAFSPNSDWFSWGIVTFQTLVGVHPYKGTHPDFKKSDLEGRMRGNASVFDSRVKLNSAVRDFAVIPKGLRDWYEAVFQKGERSAPPVRFDAPPVNTARRTYRTVQAGTGVVRHDKLLTVPGTIRHVSANGVLFYRDATGLSHAIDIQRKKRIEGLSSDAIEHLFRNEACLVRYELGFALLWLSAGALQAQLLRVEGDPALSQAAPHPLPCAATRLVSIGNRPFALNPDVGNGLLELAISTLGDKVLLSVKTAWPVFVQSTRFFDGAAVMDCMGTPFLVVPHEGAVTVGRCPDLKGYRVVNAFSRSPGFVLVEGISATDGQLYRLTYQFDGRGYQAVSSVLADEPGLDVAVNPKGILVGIFDDGQLTVINTQGSGGKTVADSSVTRDMTLFATPDGVFYYRDADVYRLSLG
jgi:hypothetical protein